MTIKMILSHDEWTTINAALRYMLMEEEDHPGSLERVQEYKDMLQHMIDAYAVALDEEEGK